MATRHLRSKRELCFEQCRMAAARERLRAKGRQHPRLKMSGTRSKNLKMRSRYCLQSASRLCYIRSRLIPEEPPCISPS
jgi:hypothetical protein